MEKQKIIGRFTPKTIGKFNGIVELHLLGGQYKLHVNFKGKASNIAEKQIMKKGPESYFPENCTK